MGDRRPNRLAPLLVVALLAASACASDGPTDARPPTTPAEATTASAPSSPTDSAPDDPVAVATDAFLAGYPLVATRRIMATFAGITGINHVVRVPRLSTIDTRLVVAPNRDTTYALAVLDLRGEPQALTVPAIDRYHTF